MQGVDRSIMPLHMHGALLTILASPDKTEFFYIGLVNYGCAAPVADIGNSHLGFLSRYRRLIKITTRYWAFLPAIRTNGHGVKIHIDVVLNPRSTESTM
jgi:hypothetical protein